MEFKNTKWTIASFISRHLVASIVSIVLPVIIVIVGYFVLLLIAIITDEGLGGPLALPFGVLIAFVLSLLYTALLLFPATALAEVATHSLNKWKFIAEIPISFVFLVLLIGLVTATVEYLTLGSITLKQWSISAGLAIALLAVPLGLYWWTTKFSQLLVEGLRKVFIKLRGIFFRAK